MEALEGPIAPMECFHPDPEGKVSCSHETDGDHACATKLLWTRVQGGVTKALSGTTLADLVEFAEGIKDRRRGADPAAPGGGAEDAAGLDASALDPTVQAANHDPDRARTRMAAHLFTVEDYLLEHRTARALRRTEDL